MKSKKILMTLALSLTLVCGIVIGANAAGTLEQISAYLNYGITVKYDGETQMLKDASGDQTYPITYKGTTYLPVRSISNIFGVAVNWDQATQTVLLGTPEEGVDLIDTIQPYSVSEYIYDIYQNVQSAEKKTTSVAGIEVGHWIQMHNRYYDTHNHYGYYNIGGAYDLLTFQAYSTADVKLEVRGDNDSVLQTISITANQLPKTYTIPLQGTSQLCFNADIPGESDLYIFDARLK